MSSSVRPALAARAAAASFALVAGLASGAFAATYPAEPSVNLPVAVKPGEQSVQKAATLPDGTTWIGWFDNSNGGYQVFVQRLSPAGTKTFAEGGLLVSNAPQSTSLVDWDLIADADGACVVVFTDTRDGEDRDVIAQRITPAGEQQWGTNGKQISFNNDFEAAPRVVQDAVTGEYHITWTRSDSARGIYYQRLTAAGVEQVAVGGVRAAGDGVEGPGFNTMVATADGGYIMVYVRDTRSFSSPRHVHAQKYDSAGQPAWNDGNPVIVSNATSIPIAQYPQIALAPDGLGVAIAWSDDRDGDFDVYAQRLDADGVPQFPANGVTASIRPNRQQFEPAIAFINDSLEFLCFFNDRNATQSQRTIGVQKFGLTGTRDIGDHATDLLQFNNQNKGAPRAVPAPGGGMVAFTLQPNSAQGNFSAQIILIRVNDRGGAMWQSLGGSVLVSDASGEKSRLIATIDDDVTTRLIWQDHRADAGDIYAQNVKRDGTLGASEPCPGDTNGDNVVDFVDLNAVLSNYGQEGPGIAGDLTGDNVVNFLDLNLVLTEYGNACE